MMASAWSACAWGVALGALNGATARRSLHGALDKPDKIFYAVFATGFLWRLLFLAGAVWLLRQKNCIILLSFSGALIFAQLIFGAVPLTWISSVKIRVVASHRAHGTKDNT